MVPSRSVRMQVEQLKDRTLCPIDPLAFRHWAPLLSELETQDECSTGRQLTVCALLVGMVSAAVAVLVIENGGFERRSVTLANVRRRLWS